MTGSPSASSVATTRSACACRVTDPAGVGSMPAEGRSIAVTRCPASSSPATILYQHQAPCHAPWTRRKCRGSRVRRRRPRTGGAVPAMAAEAATPRNTRREMRGGTVLRLLPHGAFQPAALPDTAWPGHGHGLVVGIEIAGDEAHLVLRGDAEMHRMVVGVVPLTGEAEAFPRRQAERLRVPLDVRMLPVVGDHQLPHVVAGRVDVMDRHERAPTVLVSRELDDLERAGRPPFPRE